MMTQKTGIGNGEDRAPPILPIPDGEVEAAPATDGGAKP
jgi:hypothetical protein